CGGRGAAGRGGGCPRRRRRGGGGGGAEGGAGKITPPLRGGPECKTATEWRDTIAHLPPEVLADRPRPLRRHTVGDLFARRQLEADAQRCAARPCALRERPLAPVLAHRHGVEAHERFLRTIVDDRSGEPGIVAARRLLHVGVFRQQRSTVEPE